MPKYLVEVNVKGRKGRRYFYAVYSTITSSFLTRFVEGLESFRRKYPQYLDLDPINWKEVFGPKVRAHLKNGYLELTYRMYKIHLTEHGGKGHYHLVRIKNSIASGIRHKVVGAVGKRKSRKRRKLDLPT